MANQEGDAGYDKCGGHRRRAEKPCQRPAGWGTDHPGIGTCKLHLGCTRNHKRSAEIELARRECAALGIPIDTTPADALIEEVREACGNVAFYRAMIQQLPAHPEPDEFVATDDGEGHWERGDIGIYGPTYHVSGVPTGEAKEHILLRLYNEERKRKLDAASAALRAGVDERRVRIAEADAERIMGAQVLALTAMGLGDRLEEFRRGFIDHLGAGDEPAHLGAAGTG
jgi:hypothetical protein